jgi:predicted glycoside hydrolase/deacetylase ChbG (UPF0249 family)
MKTLLATSDDLGMCHAINEGIVLGMTKGWIKSSNFLAPTPWFNEAVELGKRHKLALGVHLNLTCDWDRLKWGPLTANPRLRTADGSLPSLHTGLEALGATDDDLYDELKAQILLVKKAYGEPTHLDTHMAGGHWNGGVYDRLQKVVLRLSGEFKLPYSYQRDPQTKQLKHFVEEDCQSGWTREAFLKKLDGWQAPGAYHLFGHAAVDTPELHAICSESHPSRHWAADWRIKDLALYMDQSLEKAMEDKGFKLVGAAEALR